jgi:VWFA-related protein
MARKYAIRDWRGCFRKMWMMQIRINNIQVGRILNKTLPAVLLALPLAVSAQQTPSDGSQPPQTQQTAPSQSQDIPDAPSAVQPPLPKPVVPAEPLPDAGSQPSDSSSSSSSSSSSPSSSAPATSPSGAPGEPSPVPPSPVQTVPSPNGPRNQINPSEGIYKISVPVNFVLLPVMVKDRDGRRVDGLSYTDFTVLENGKKQALTYFTTDPFQLSVAIIIDTGMPDVALQKVNETYSALAGAFTQYDEVAVYTYSSTVSQASDFSNKPARLATVFNQLKLVRGDNNGPPDLNSPFSVGPTVNGVPVSGPPIAPVQTPERDAHVLNDAILRATLDLSKRAKTRRKVIFVISDGREFRSQNSYRAVLRVIQSHDIEVKAVVLDMGALPVFKQAEKLPHLFLQGYSDILPKYVAASGGGHIFTELTRNSIEVAYAEVANEARNQYTLGYSPKATTSTSAYRSIEVRVDKRDVKISTKDGYYPALGGR